MMTSFDFTTIDPADGWHVVVIDGTTYCSLSLELRVGNVAQPIDINDKDACFVTLFEKVRPTAEDCSTLIRLQRLAEALCRYFNSGGQWDHVFALVEKMKWVVGPMDAFAGWTYHDTFVNTNAQYEHVFVSTTEPAVGVVWIEDVVVMPPEPWDKLKDDLYVEPEEGRATVSSSASSSRLQLGHDPEEE
jgi:hypothetical protein